MLWWHHWGKRAGPVLAGLGNACSKFHNSRKNPSHLLNFRAIFRSEIKQEVKGGWHRKVKGWARKDSAVFGALDGVCQRNELYKDTLSRVISFSLQGLTLEIYNICSFKIRTNMNRNFIFLFDHKMNISFSVTFDISRNGLLTNVESKGKQNLNVLFESYLWK